MTEYTPTTEQVENAYSFDPEYEYHNPVDTGYVARNRAAFKRWLAEHDREKQEAAFDLCLDEVGENWTRNTPIINPYRKKD